VKLTLINPLHSKEARIWVNFRKGET
jgi:hypothetical protein